MRQHRCPSLWIRCLDKQLQHILRCQEGFPYKGIVISDVRFPDEIDFIRECNGAIWHVINCRAPLDPRHHHASERLAQDLDAIKADVIIYNNSTLDDLRHKIMKHEEAI